MKTASGAIHIKVGDFGLARHVDSDDVPLTPHPGRTSKYQFRNECCNKKMKLVQDIKYNT